ncbi:Hypothetical predicted protein [Octopus vulgaris]|uniref:Uncharacterized protein n=1 Tax=Octopus vulgaris TaxID=6645 RepID=A0AA36F6N6_OCTVU|nr:Hypothetical predicted protein [Octopus vulgaris]
MTAIGTSDYAYKYYHIFFLKRRIAMNPLACANSEVFQFSGFFNMVENNSENEGTVSHPGYVAFSPPYNLWEDVFKASIHGHSAQIYCIKEFSQQVCCGSIKKTKEDYQHQEDESLIPTKACGRTYSRLKCDDRQHATQMD